MKATHLVAVLAAMVLALATPVTACHERVHVEDNSHNPMAGVEVKISSTDCDWNPKTTETGEDGWTPWKSVRGHCTYKSEVIGGAEGYVCDTDTDYNNNDNGEMFITCVPENEVPEFSTITAGLALVGAGLYAYRKKRN